MRREDAGKAMQRGRCVKKPEGKDGVLRRGTPTQSLDPRFLDVPQKGGKMSFCRVGHSLDGIWIGRH